MRSVRTRRSLFAVLVFVAMIAAPRPALSAAEPGLATGEDEKAPLRAGLIGLDTSHVIAFTKVFNDAAAGDEFRGLRVVAGYPGGTDVPSSRDRVGKYTEQLRGMGLTIHESIEALVADVDVVLLESVDGRPHLEQALPVLRAKKPLFIDKPLAGSLVDVLAIDELARRHDVPWFSSSSLRFSPGILGLRGTSEKAGDVKGASAWGPCPIEPTHPDLFWYGIHGCEILFTIMGAGCESVTRVKTAGTELVVGIWRGGRVGTFRGIRDGKSGYGAMVFGSKAIVRSGEYEGYKPLCREIARFFETRKAPVDAVETVELFAFMEAADESKRRGGVPVRIADVMLEARTQLEARLREVGEE